MNAGGDPDRDDFGLPPVDIEIPDDARELDRDMHAYQRELRALRRRQRAGRFRGPLTREGMMLPLLAGCLILALITSTLLIMFAADQSGVPGFPGATQHASAPPSAGGQQAAGKIGGPLPGGQVVIEGKDVPLRSVTAAKAAVLTLVPLGCRCATTLQQVSTEAARAHVSVFLVGSAGLQQLAQLATQAGQRPSQVAYDPADILGRAYRPSGLTAILVRPDGTVASVVNRLPQPGLEAGLRQLALAGPAGR